MRQQLTEVNFHAKKIGCDANVLPENVFAFAWNWQLIVYKPLNFQIKCFKGEFRRKQLFTKVKQQFHSQTSFNLVEKLFGFHVVPHIEWLEFEKLPKEMFIANTLHKKEACYAHNSL